MEKRYFFFILLLLPVAIASGQIEVRYMVESDIVTGAGRYTPFYFQNNRHGLISFAPNSGYLRAALFKTDSRNRKFEWELGLDGLVGYHQPSVWNLHQAYINLRLHALELCVGSREEQPLLQNFLLSSGSMVWSGNARPIPQVRVGIPHYTRIPGTKGWLWIRGEIGYGMFCDNRYQRTTHGTGQVYAENILYHRKYLMIKAEKNVPFFGSVGIDMAAQFGGTVYNTSIGTIRFGRRLNDFLKVFFPAGGDNASPDIDRVNVVGNHVGSYLMEMGYKKTSWRLRAYYEHYFDDHSGMIFRNFPDGLWGIEWTSEEKHLLSGIVVEYVHTKSQSGPFLWDSNEYIPVQVSGGDDYYGHAAYPGWTYWGRTMGNPFITSPGMNGDGYMGFRNTRVQGWHSGLTGYVCNALRYRVLGSYTKGRGTPTIPYEEVTHAVSGLAEFVFTPSRLPAWEFMFSVAADGNKKSRNSWGIQFRVRYSGRFSLF